MQEVLTQFEDRIDPAHSAVLVVDIQNDFCAPDGYLGRKFGCDEAANEALAARNVALTDAAREAGAQIVWIQAIYDPVYLSAPMLMKGGSHGNEVRCVDGSWGADFYNVAPKEGDLIVRKHRYSAFSGTAMDNLLRRNGIRTTVVTGVSTNICVESTLREAFNLGYYVVVPRDCVASNNAELHEATLKNVEFLIGDVTSSSDLIDYWSDARTGAVSNG
ncbi:MAG: cysteine hydrolase [Rhodospirillaceae bacterium]|jgi:ureidoacrylate peracid hydrolase|nr:cysteine hydrolase [Rhodospirillaceae bacterium]MBT5458958.1 cysteine hydrolase [Rhodospirillaceae bacterium]